MQHFVACAVVVELLLYGFQMEPFQEFFWATCLSFWVSLWLQAVEMNCGKAGRKDQEVIGWLLAGFCAHRWQYLGQFQAHYSEGDRHGKEWFAELMLRASRIRSTAAGVKSLGMSHSSLEQKHLSKATGRIICPQGILTPGMPLAATYPIASS